MTSVTQVFGPWTDFSNIPEGVLERAAERGTQVHGAIASYLMGLYVPPLQPDVQLRYDSLRRWVDEMVKEVLLVEHELECTCYGYIGHPDFVGVLKGETTATLLDWKNPVVTSKTWEAQVAGGYWHLVEKHASLAIPLARCGAIMANPNGSIAKMVEYTGSQKRAEAGFLNALFAYKYFKEEG